jgi:VanZ family protein
MRALIAARAAFILWAAAVAYLSLTEDTQTIDASFDLVRRIAMLLGNEELSDKIGHFLSYFALGALAVATKYRVFATWFVAVAVLAGYGLAIEGLQGIGGVRTPDLYDGLADTLGATTGAGLALAWMRRGART